MGSENSFQVMARAPKHGGGNPAQIGMALARAYGLDPTALSQVFATRGIVIQHTSTLEEARAWAHRIREFGADAVILNAFGSVVAEVRVAAPPPPAPQQKVTDKTLLGIAPPTEERRTDLGLAKTLIGGASPPAALDGPVKELLPLDLSPSRDALPPTPVSTDEALSRVDADALVMLDGSVEQAPEEDAISIPVPVKNEAFAPPVQDESLELEAIDLPQGTIIDEAEEEGPDEANEEPSPPPFRHAGLVSGSALRRPSVSPLDSAREFLGSRPRFRTLIGFVLALGLGAVVPTCYSESVYSSRIVPLLEDLSTAQAHGHLLKGQADYRSPAEITRQIDSIKTRYGIYTFLIWLLIAGGLGFGWYYLTREG